MSNLVKYVDRVGTDCNKWDSMDARFGDNDLMALWGRRYGLQGASVRH